MTAAAAQGAGINTAEWLDGIRREFGLGLALSVACELLLGRNDAAAVAQSVSARGMKIANPDMVLTTEQDVEDVLNILTAAGYLRAVLVTDHEDGEEHVLELRMPLTGPRRGTASTRHMLPIV